MRWAPAAMHVLAPGTPTGQVTFDDGSTVLGTVELNAGTASFSISTLSVGTHSIKVVYGGDTNFKTSTSASLSQVVQGTASAADTITQPGDRLTGSGFVNGDRVGTGGRSGSRRPAG